MDSRLYWALNFRKMWVLQHGKTHDNRHLIEKRGKRLLNGRPASVPYPANSQHPQRPEMGGFLTTWVITKGLWDQ